MAEDNDIFDSEIDDEELESQILDSEIASKKINMDARRKLEYLQELKALKKELGEDYYDDLSDQI